jgi:two-component system sensor histidine kinase HydH
MRILQPKRLYLPALSIVAVVLLLLVLIGISTYRNLNRQKLMALDSLHRQGLTLIGSLEAGIRAGMMSHMWGEDSVGSLIEEMGKHDEIAYVYLLDDQGVVSHHSDPSRDGTPATWQPQLSSQDQTISRVRTVQPGSKVYEIARKFEPLRNLPRVSRPREMMRRGRMKQFHAHPYSTIVLGLKMTAYEEARKGDFHHALIMAAILLALGTAALFFIFVIQNYYLVERTLKETQDYTAQVLANMADGLLSVDLDGRVVSYNPLALELLGLRESRVRGLNLRRVIDFEATGINDTLSHCQAALDREILLGHGSGEVVPLALSVTPILGGENECRGAVVILRDLREIKQLEEKVRRSERLAAIGKLAAGVAHEIRNPLSSIRGFAQYLGHALSGKPEDLEYVAVMVKEVDRINEVVTDLLTFSRPMEVELAATDVNQLLEHTARLVQADAESRGVEIIRSISPDLSNFAMDSNQMTQALLNLVLNAMQVSESGFKIELGAALDGSGSHLRIWVEDDGPGIAAENMGKIFDPFFTTREEGSGLGLAIVHAIVENHRGEIKVESPPRGKDRGSRFTISIPVQSHGASDS